MADRKINQKPCALYNQVSVPFDFFSTDYYVSSNKLKSIIHAASSRYQICRVKETKKYIEINGSEHDLQGFPPCHTFLLARMSNFQVSNVTHTRHIPAPTHINRPQLVPKWRWTNFVYAQLSYVIPLTVPHRNKEIVFADVFVLFCCLSFSLPRPSPFLFYSLLFGVIHFICVLKASRHLFGHHFPFLLADELPPPWYGYRAIYFTPTRPVWDCRPLYTTHIYKYTRVLLSQYYLSVSHTGLRLWEIHNGLASIYNIYRSPASYIATDIFFFLSLSFPFPSLLLFRRSKHFCFWSSKMMNGFPTLIYYS